MAILHLHTHAWIKMNTTMRTAFLLLLFTLLFVSSFAHHAHHHSASSMALQSQRRADEMTEEERMDDADKEETRDVVPDKTPPESRECELKGESDQVTLGCKAETPEDASTEIQDEIDFLVQASYKGVGVLVEYKQEIDSEVLESETETSFEIWFDRIIEYAKANGSSSSQAYDWQEDTVVKTLFLLEWEDFTEVQTDNMGLLTHFSVTTPQGVATFNFTISPGGSGEMLSANKIKIDFLLSDLTWKERDDTYVALISNVESERNVELDYDDGDHTEESVMPRNALISFQREQDSDDELIPLGEFSWQTTAQAIDNTTEISNGNATLAVERSAELGTTIQVVATSPPIQSERQPGDKSSEFIAFSFIGEGARSASKIYWDPEAGIRYGSATSTSGVARRVGSTLSVVVASVVGALSFVVI